MQKTQPVGNPPTEPAEDVRIEVARVEDIPSLQVAAANCWWATYADIFTNEFIQRFLTRAYSVESMERALTNRRTHFIVAKREDEVVAFSQTGPPTHPHEALPGCGELYRLYVTPTWQRRGLGRRLLADVEGWLSAQGFARYGCYVHARNDRAKLFYAQFNFTRLPERDLDDEWYLVKELG
jgi:diamine N-acetyltransferase